MFASGAFLGLRKGGSGKASFANAAVLFFWLSAQVVAFCRVPLLISCCCRAVLSLAPCYLAAFFTPLLLPASPLSDSLFPSSRPFFVFWGMLLNFGVEIRS